MTKSDTDLAQPPSKETVTKNAGHLVLSSKDMLDKVNNMADEPFPEINNQFTLIASTFFNMVYITFKQDLLRFVRTMIHSDAEAEDIVQETFIRAWQKIETLRDPEKFSEWIYTIARYRALESLRQRQREVRIQEKIASQQRKLTAWDAMQAHIAENEWRSTINEMIEAMPETRRKILQYHYLQEYSCKEIAQVLHMPVNTIKTHLYRGRGELKQQISKIYEHKQSRVSLWDLGRTIDNCLFIIKIAEGKRHSLLKQLAQYEIAPYNLSPQEITLVLQPRVKQLQE